MSESIKEDPQERAQQRPVEQIVRVPVPQIQEQVIVQGIPGAQVVKRIRVNIVETIPQERVQQRTDEKIVRAPVPTVQKQMMRAGKIRVLRLVERITGTHC